MPGLFFLSDRNEVTDNYVLADSFSDNGKYIFLLRNINGENVQIISPDNLDRSWDAELFSLYVFQNPYLNLEKNIYNLNHQEVNDGRIGMIFPLLSLISNERFEDFRNFDKYRYIAYVKLLTERDILMTDGRNPKEYYITELFPDNTAVCLISNDSVANLTWNIDDYILSFYKAGYHEAHLGTFEKIPSRTDSVMAYADKDKIKIKKAGYDVSSDTYIESLFRNYLLNAKEPVMRFVFLYQIIEYFMESEFETLVNAHVQKHQNGILTKNDLKEALIEVSSEKKLISRLIQKWNTDNQAVEAFNIKWNEVLKNLGREQKHHFSELLYSFRNTLVHGYRLLLPYEDDVKILVGLLDVFLCDVLINFRKEMP